MSKVRIVFVPTAELEYEEARQWYETREGGLGLEFAVEVDACLERIRQSPQMYARVKKNYRQAFVRRFPYAIFYEFENSEVTVYSVFHGAGSGETRSPPPMRGRPARA